MPKMTGKITAVFLGPADEEFDKEKCETLQVEIDGFVGDRHRGTTRENWFGDKQAKDVVRRNERQWSAMSLEELNEIQAEMALDQPLTAGCLGVNLLIEGISHLTQLPKGTIIKFPSGAELMVEEFNPPCPEMSTKLAETFTANGGDKLELGAFPRAAKHKRGIVGTIEVAGTISAGDSLEVSLYSAPKWANKY
jgi:MOSC domain-containing protein YiiM